MKKVLFATLALSLLFAFAAVADENGGNTKCPVMGGKVNKSIYVDIKDKRIFLCCAGCDADQEGSGEVSQEDRRRRRKADAAQGPERLPHQR